MVGGAAGRTGPTGQTAGARDRFAVLGIGVDRLDIVGSAARIAAFVAARTPRQVVTVNPEFVIAARRDPGFRRVLRQADLATADGMGIVWAARILGERLPERVGGVELLHQVAENAARLGHTLFLLGAQPGVATAAGEVLVRQYPGLRIVGADAGSPDPADEEMIIAMVQQARPDILFVAFGAPAQDLWIARTLPRLGVPVAIGVGGAFDYLAGRVPRAPELLQRAGLEWLYRLVIQPWRWRRMLALPRFAALVIADRLGNSRPQSGGSRDASSAGSPPGGASPRSHISSEPLGDASAPETSVPSKVGGGPPTGLHVALVHDYLTQYGGAEKVLEALHELWPLAPIYTTFYDPAQLLRLGFRIPSRIIRPILPSWLPHRGKAAKLWTPLYPLLFRRLSLVRYNLVISSSSFAAHHVRASARTTHLCYCHTPPRFLYGLSTEVDHRRLRRWIPLLPVFYAALRALDRQAAARVTAYIANSREVQARIRRCYDRDATVIYPPVDIAAFTVSPSSTTGGYFLSYGRLVKSKRHDLAVQAATTGGLPLIVAGRGGDLGRLRGLAGPTVRFVDSPDPPALRALLTGCRALVFAAEEDFGIVPVEAMAAGKPVIAFDGGGARESVVPGETGTFFTPQSHEALLEAMRGFDPNRYSPERCRARAAEFDAGVFDRRIRAYLMSLAHFQQRQQAFRRRLPSRNLAPSGDEDGQLR